MIDSRHEACCSTKAECAVTDEFDFVVDSFRGAVGNAKSRPGENALDVGLDHSSELCDRIETAVSGLPEPGLKESLRMKRAVIAPEELETFLEQVGADQTA